MCAAYQSSNRSTPTLAPSIDPASAMNFMDGDVKDIFEVDREASGAAPQLSKDAIMGATVKVTRITLGTESILTLPRS